MPDRIPNSSVRLNKYLAERLGIGRRQADLYIQQQKVRLNGQVPPLGARVNSTGDIVTVNNKPVAQQQTYVYLMLHKPAGYVCSRRQQGDTPTIYQLLPAKYQQLKPVGRLDKDSSGLLLLTNDGDFALRMTHPRFAKLKRYGVQLNKPLQTPDRRLIDTKGVALADGVSKLELEPLQTDGQHWLVSMREGRNRQIRRTFGELGYTVVRLHRVQFGAYDLDDLAPGDFRVVSLA